MIPRRALAAGRKYARSATPVFDETHPLIGLIGAARSGGRSPGARNKHAILDEK
jgi:hypothetical protein